MDEERPATAGAEYPAAPARGRHRHGRIRKTIGGVIIVPLVLLVLVVLLLQNDAIATRVLNDFASRAGLWPESSTVIGDVDLDGLSAISLHDARVVSALGDTMVVVDSARFQLRPLGLIRGRLHFTKLWITGASISLHQQPDSSWDLLSPFLSPDSLPSKQRRLVIIDQADITRTSIAAHFLAARDSVLRVRLATLRMSGFRNANPLQLTIDELHATMLPPDRSTPAKLAARLSLRDDVLQVNGLRLESDSSNVTAYGTLLLPGGEIDAIHDIDFQLAAEPLDFRDVGAFVPGFDLAGSLRLTARVRGTARALDIEADGTTFDGGRLHVAGTVTPDPSGPVRYTLDAKVRDLDPTFWKAGASPRAPIDADVRVALAGPSRRMLSGSVRARLDATRIRGLDLEPTSLHADFQRGTARYTLDSGVHQQAIVRAHGTIRPFDPDPDWDANLDLRQTRLLARGGVRIAESTLHADITGTGLSPETMTGRVAAVIRTTIGDLRIRDARVDGTWNDGSANLRLASTMEPGRIAAHTIVDWGGGAFRVRVESLNVDRLQLADIMGDTMRGSVTLNGSGSIVLRGANDRSADLRLAIERAVWRDLVIDTSTATLQLRDDRLAASARITSPAARIDLAAHARPFDAVPSYTIDSARVRSLDLSRVRDSLPETDVTARLELQAAGRGDSLNAQGRLVMQPSVIGAATLDTADVSFDLNDGQLRLEGDARLLDGSLHLAATGRPLDDVPTLHVEPLRFENIRLDSLGSGRFRATVSGTLVANAELPPAALPRIAGTLTLDPTDINAGHLRAGRVEFDWNGRDASLDADLRTAKGGAEVKGDASFVEQGGGRLRLASAKANGTVHLPDIAAFLGRDSAEAALDARFSVAGQGTDVSTMRWTVNAAMQGSWDEARLDSLRVDARLVDAVLTVDTLLLASSFARGSGGGSVAIEDGRAAGGDSLRLRIVSDSVASLGRMVGLRPLALRGGTLVATAANEESGIRVNASMDLGGLISPAGAVDTLSSDMKAMIHDRRLAAAHVTFDGSSVSAGSIFFEHTAGTVDYDTSEIRFDASLEGDANHTLKAAGTIRQLERSLAIESLDMALDAESWSLASPATIKTQPAISVSGFRLVEGSRSIIVDGTIDRKGAEDFSVRLDSVPIAGMTGFIGLDNVTGTLNGTIDLAGPASRVSVTSALQATINDAYLEVSTAPRGPDGLSVGASLIDPDGQPLSLQGTVPFRLSLDPGVPGRLPDGAPMDLEVRADSFSLAWLTPLLAPAGVERLESRLAVDAHIDGSFGSPRMNGTGHLAGGRIEIPAQGVRYSGINGELTFQGDRVHIASMTAQSDGIATARGDIIFETMSQPQFDLQVRFDDFRAVETEYTRLGLNGALKLTGDLAEPHVEGDLRIDDTDIWVDRMGRAGSTAVELTREDYQMLESYFGYRPTAAAATQRDLLQPWGIQLELSLGNDVWLRRRTTPQMQLQLAGSLDVRKTPGDSIQLFGTVSTIAERSFFEELGQRFSVERGTVTFNGPIYGFHTDIEAQYPIPSAQDPTTSEAVITLDVSGTWQDLDMTLGSRPQMKTSDILSYLATGRPAASAAEFGNTGATIALDRAASLLEEEATEHVGLDVVEIRQQGLKGATLVAGRYVTPRLFVAFQQPLTQQSSSEDARTTSQRSTQVELEYTLYRWLVAKVQGGESSISFFFRTRYAF